MSEAKQQRISGKLTLTVFRCRSLWNVKMLGTQDPFFRVHLDRQDPSKAYVSKVHQDGGIEPNWEETITYMLDGTETNVFVEVLHKAVINSVIGTTRITIADLVGSPAPKWYPLERDNNGGYAGDIYMSVLMEYNKDILKQKDEAHEVVVKSLNARIQGLEADLKALRQENVDLRVKMERMQTEFTLKHKQFVEEDAQEDAAYEQRIKNLEETKEDVQNRLNAQIGTLNWDLEQARNKVTAATEQIAVLTADVDRERAENAALKQQLAEQTEHAKKEKESLVAQHEAALAETKGKFGDVSALVGKDLRVTAMHCGLSWDMWGANSNNHAELRQNNWGGSNNQKFNLVPAGDGYYFIKCKHSGKYLDVQGASEKDGAVIVQFDTHGGENQRFHLMYWPRDDSYFIMNKRSGKVFDVKGDHKNVGELIHQWSINGGANQRYKLTVV